MFHNQWVDRVNQLLALGHDIAPREQGTLEELDVTVRAMDSSRVLIDVPSRKLNFRFAVAEFVWMAFGRSDVVSIQRYNSKLLNFTDTDNPLFLTGAYGPHIHAQDGPMLAKIRRDPATRQAVIEIPRPRRETKDEPCTLSMQFLLRDGALNLIVTMRSSDVWLGLPYDIFTFSMFQNVYAGTLGVRRGWLSMHLGSSHLYHRDRDAARLVVDDRDADTIRMPAMMGLPPAWLEQVFLDPDNGARFLDEASPWAAFARALMSKTSAEARDHLRTQRFL